MTTGLVCSISITILVLMEIFLLNRVMRLRRFAYSDELTGLSNFRGFIRAVRSLLYKAKRENSELTIAIVDVDNFRRFNRESYRLGDNVLVEFCSLITHTLPPDSIIARFKIGDEFIVAFPRAGRAAAEQHLKRLLSICASSDFNCLSGLPGCSVSFSYGIAVCNTSEAIEVALEKAELSLKAHKGHA